MKPEGQAIRRRSQSEKAAVLRRSKEKRDGHPFEQRLASLDALVCSEVEMLHENSNQLVQSGEELPLTLASAFIHI